jgi:vacuolar-type H+-ATPase subunit E/Vma4
MFVTILTVVVAVGIYLFRNDGELFKKVSKEKILEFAYNKLEEKIDLLKSSPMKDSVKTLVTKEFNNLKNEKFDTAMNKFGQFADLIKSFSIDEKIDSTEFNELKTLVLYHERSKKN